MQNREVLLVQMFNFQNYTMDYTKSPLKAVGKFGPYCSTVTTTSHEAKILVKFIYAP